MPQNRILKSKPGDTENVPPVAKPTAPKQRRIRLIDVAKEAGVSRVAAGQVLIGTGGPRVRVSDATRQRVLEVAKRLGYRPDRIAQQLRGARSQMLGVILDTDNLPVMFERLAALEAETRRQGYRLMIGQTHGDPLRITQYLDDFEGRGVDGIVFLFDLLRGYEDRLGPVFSDRGPVVYHSKALTPNGACVRVDTASGIQQSIAHLIDRGRNRIALVLGNIADQKMEVRRLGYLLEFTARNLPIDEELIWSLESATEVPTREVLDRAIDDLVCKKKVDAMIAVNDVWAVRLIQRLKDRGFRVPADVAMIGYDNLDLATVIDPALTTIDQDHPAYAKAVLDLMQELLERQEPSVLGREIVVPPKLIIREST
jgi:DNA-binding LacI/PurR family transcriptional regulator